MKRSNLRLTGIEKQEETQLKGPENIFNKVIEGDFPNLKKQMPIKVQEIYRTPNRLEQKRNYTQHIIILTLNVHNQKWKTRSNIKRQTY